MMTGIIIKGVGGFYYVKTKEGIIESRARGVFRDENRTPLVGDKVDIKISEEDGNGYIIDIHERTSQLARPSVANITQVIIVMSVKNPDINTWLLDRFLVVAEHENLDVVICINKSDLLEKKANDLKDIYEKAGYKVIITSTILDLGIKELEASLNNNISVLAGPSGAGKSTILNKINPNFKLETGDVSVRTGRGKHTTRHVELFNLNENSYILDTPGFSSLNLEFIEDSSQLKYYFREINKIGKECRFNSCLHDQEPGCMVKQSVEENVIDSNRYNNYILLLKEIEKIRRY